MFAEEAEKSTFPRDVADYIMARTSFSGSLAGSLTVALPEEVSAEIAANFLGIESRSHRALRLSGDALREFVNVACGTLLGGLTDRRADVSITTPVTFELDPVDWMNLLEESDSVGFMVDGRPVLVWLWLKK